MTLKTEYDLVRRLRGNSKLLSVFIIFRGRGKAGKEDTRRHFGRHDI
jgi:hypothetical protein